MARPNSILIYSSYLAPSLIAVGILIIDIYVSAAINSNYSVQHDICRSGGPDPSTTLLLAVTGLAISIYGVIRAFRNNHRWIGSIAIIMTLLVLFAGIVSMIGLSFAICF